jgi:hypothetical protein
MFLVAAPLRADGPAGTFTPTGSMTTPRSFHTATLLPGGKVLIAGGAQSMPSASEVVLASAELYDASAGAFSPAGNMTTARRLHTATLLPDGRVLIAGGYGTEAALDSAEVYDYATGAFTATGKMMVARGGHTAILLPNGTVMIVGGYGSPPFEIAPAELYDPATGMFTHAAPYSGKGGCDFCAPAVLLSGGKVLFPGQHPAQLYDPVSNAFSLTGEMISDHSPAALLANGKVLFAGGEGAGRYSDAELYDPASGTFLPTGNMTFRRVWHTMTLLPDGMVLTAGGETDSCAGNACMFFGSVASAELYDPATGTFIETGDMAAPRETHTATLLNDGRVLIAGGVSYGGIGIFFGCTASAELYNPPLPAPSPVLFSVSGDGRGQGAILHAGTARVPSSDDPAVAGSLLEIYCNGLTDGSVIPPQVSIGGRMAEVLFFGKAPGLPKVNQVNVRVPGGVAPGLAVTVRLNYLGRPSNDVTVAIR